MQLFVRFLVIGFLEQNVGADTCLVQLSVIFYRGGGNVDIDAADCSVFVLNSINGINAFQNVFNRVVYGVFSQFQRQALMSHILQSNNFLTDFLLSHLFAEDMLVFNVVWAVNTAVYAIVGKIKRGKKHNAVAVVVLFYTFGKCKNFCLNLWIVTSQQNRSFTMRQTFFLLGFV